MTAEEAGRQVGPDVEAVVGQILEALEQRHEEVARGMLGAILAEVPAYTGLTDPFLIDSVRRHCSDLVGCLARVLRSKRLPMAEELDFVRHVAVARTGVVPPETLLHSYRVGHRVVWDWLMAQGALTSASGDVTRELAAWCIAYTDQISVVAAEACLREQQRRRYDRVSARRELLDDVLGGHLDAGTEALGVRATALGLDTKERHFVAVAVLDIPGDEERLGALERLAEVIANDSTRGHGVPFVVMRHRELVALMPIKGRTVRGVRADMGRAIQSGEPTSASLARVGISTVCQTLVDLPRRYQEAHQALLMTSAHRPVVALPEVSLLDYLIRHADSVAVRLVSEGSRHLVAEDHSNGGALVATLRAYLDADLNVAAAARALHVHPNTVHHRLRRIASLSGIDPRHGGALVELVIAVRVLEEAGSRE